LRFVCGRHDLPFYYHDEVELQRSFMDAFLKGEDRVGWSIEGKVPPVDLVLRKGDVGFNNPTGEQKFPRRTEMEWPIARTKYTPFYLTAEKELITTNPALASTTKLSYRALVSYTSPYIRRRSRGVLHRYSWGSSTALQRVATGQYAKC
jgi:predicted acyl esterase